MQRLEVSGAVRPIYGSLGVKRLRIQERGRRETLFYAGRRQQAEAALGLCGA